MKNKKNKINQKTITIHKLTNKENKQTRNKLKTKNEETKIEN